MAKSDLFRDEKPGPMQAIIEGVQAIAPGLSLSAILHDVGQEVKEQAVMGSHELASALFRGDAFVMYPRTGSQEAADHSLPDQQQEQERGGREM